MQMLIWLQRRINFERTRSQAVKYLSRATKLVMWKQQWLSPTKYPGTETIGDIVGSLPRCSHLPAAVTLAAKGSQLCPSPKNWTQPPCPEFQALTGWGGEPMTWAHAGSPLHLQVEPVPWCSPCTRAPCGIQLKLLFSWDHISAWVLLYPLQFSSLLFSCAHAVSKSGAPETLFQLLLLGNLT